MKWLKRILRRFKKPAKLHILERIGIEAVRRRHRGEDVRNVVISTHTFWSQARDMGIRIEYLAGFPEFFHLHTAAGTLRVIADPDCPADHFRFVGIGVAP